MTVPLDTVNDIRSMDAAGRSRSEIVRVLHVSRNTVVKYADMEESQPLKKRARFRCYDCSISDALLLKSSCRNTKVTELEEIAVECLKRGGVALVAGAELIDIEGVERGAEESTLCDSTLLRCRGETLLISPVILI